MNSSDDRDEVGDLLQRGYAADVPAGLADSLLARLHGQMRRRSRHRWLLGGAIAAGVAALFGLAGVMYCVLARPSAPAGPTARTGGAEATVVCGRILKWDAPVAEFAVSRTVRGTVDDKTLYVDLSRDLESMRRRVSRAVAIGSSSAPAEADVVAQAATLFASLLNRAGATEMVLELAPGSADGSSARQGRIMGWSGVADLPPLDRHFEMDKTIVNVVDSGLTASLRPRLGNLLRDEWGMPR